MRLLHPAVVSCTAIPALRSGFAPHVTPRIVAASPPQAIMSLEPLHPRVLQSVLPLVPTKPQLNSFWGRTTLERQGHVMETIGVSFLWLWCGYFFSRTMLGNIATWFFGLMVVVRTVADPILWSWQMNARLRGEGRKFAMSSRAEGRKGALFCGRVVHVSTEFSPRDTEHHMHFTMRVADTAGREIEFEVPMVPEYKNIETGQRCETVLLSEQSDFTELSATTEAFIPAIQVFVGNYPHLHRQNFMRLSEKRLQRRRALARRKAEAERATKAKKEAEDMRFRPVRHRGRSRARTAQHS